LSARSWRRAGGDCFAERRERLLIEIASLRFVDCLRRGDVRGDIAARSFSMVYVKQGKALVMRRASPDRMVLADANIPLKMLWRAC
jgi:hypothetical protein